MSDKDEMWNWLCKHCGWCGVAQKLQWDDRTAENRCPTCLQTDVHDVDWHKGKEKANKFKTRHI
mgnify:CR=1 FL=1|jgi:hypothetical protein